MESQLYRIIFEGKIVEGFDEDTAKANLQRLFKTDRASVEKLFSGKRVVLKKGITAAEVQNYHGALNNAGLRFTAEAEQPSSPNRSPTKTASGKRAKKSPAGQARAKPQDGSSSKGSRNPYAPPTQNIEVSKQVFCRSCGNKINATDKVCPGCGDKQIVGKPKSKLTAALLAIFLGFLGAHRFYLGQWLGLLYLLFGILAWPIALIEGIVFLLTDQEKWQRKYGNVVTSGGPVLFIVAAFLFIAMLGIVAAVALPTYQDYVHRATVAGVVAEVQPSLDKIDTFILRERNYPDSNRDAGLAADFSSDQIKSIVVGATGVLTVTLGNAKGNALNDQTLVWVPQWRGASVHWDCSGGTLHVRFRPPPCRTGIYSGQQPPVSSHWVTSEDGLTKMRLPESWRQLPNLTELGVIEYGNFSRQHYLVVISELKQNFTSNMDLSAYNRLLMEHKSETGIDKIRIKYLGEINLNGMKGLKFELRGEVNGVSIVYLQVAVEGANHFHHVLFWTSPARWGDTAAVYETALATFTECAGGCGK
jgi:TM2 domain-containing membrane protein YozV/Tfp pilus assembly major pilin PilA